MLLRSSRKAGRQRPTVAGASGVAGAADLQARVCPLAHVDHLEPDRLKAPHRRRGVSRRRLALSAPRRSPQRASPSRSQSSHKCSSWQPRAAYDGGGGGGGKDGGEGGGREGGGEGSGGDGEGGGGGSEVGAEGGGGGSEVGAEGGEAAAARAVAGLLQVALDVALVVGDALADRCVEELDKVAPLPLCVPLVAKLELHQVARHLNRDGGAQRSESLLLRRRPN